MVAERGFKACLRSTEVKSDDLCLLRDSLKIDNAKLENCNLASYIVTEAQGDTIEHASRIILESAVVLHFGAPQDTTRFSTGRKVSTL